MTGVIHKHDDGIRDLIPADVLEEVRHSIGSMSGIVEVTTDCNLSCDYCFAHRPDMPIMPLPVVQRIIRELLMQNGREMTTKFIWHGGEPLLAGLRFYEEVVAAQNEMARDGFKSENALQPNATLLDDDWIDFFAKIHSESEAAWTDCRIFTTQKGAPRKGAEPIMPWWKS